MPKQKTHKGSAKRMKLTGKGKVKRHQAGKGHLMSGKGGTRKRSLRGAVLISKTVEKKHRIALGS